MPKDVDIKTLNENVLVTVVRLLNDPAAQHLAQPLYDSVMEVQVANAAANQVRNPEIMARAWMEIGRLPIVQLVLELELDTEKVVGRQFTAAPYPALFKDHNVDSHRRAAPEALKTEIDRKIKVIGKLPTNSILRPFVPRLQKAVKAWQPLVAKHEAALKALGGAEEVLKKKIAAVGKLLFNTHGKLENINEDKKWVESFFVPWVVPSKKKKKAQPTPPSPMPPAAPPAGP